MPRLPYPPSPGCRLGMPVLAAAFLALPLRAEGQAPTPPSTGPVIEGFGPVWEIPDPDVPTPTDRMLRAVFDVASSPEDPAQLSRSIETLARYLNMHVRAGVPREHLKVALILHGGAGKDALGDEGYRRRYGIDNPNLPLLEELAEFGVELVLCGQTQSARGLRREELAEPVKVALSAMTALVDFQDRGYRLIAF